MTHPATTALAATAVALLALSGCGSHHGLALGTVEPTLLEQDEPGFGPLVTDPSGAVVYLDTRDDRSKPTCVGACAQLWIPLVVPDGSTAQAGVGIDAAKIGTVPRPGGGVQITYGGWPLYTYLGDHYTFTVTGNGRHDGGGTFHPVTPAGVAGTPRG